MKQKWQVLVTRFKLHRSEDNYLRQEMGKILDSLGYDFNHFTVPSFFQHVEKLRGKTFHYVPRTLVEHGAFGVWVTSDYKELFFYDEEAVPSHRIYIIMHEMGHLLCGHDTEYRTPEQVDNILAGEPFELTDMLSRYHHVKEDDDEDDNGEDDDGDENDDSGEGDDGDDEHKNEQQVEMIALLLRERILKNRKLEQLTSFDPVDEATRNYLKSIGLG